MAGDKQRLIPFARRLMQFWQRRIHFWPHVIQFCRISVSWQ
jgi:hypothetical protein